MLNKTPPVWYPQKDSRGAWKEKKKKNCISPKISSKCKKSPCQFMCGDCENMIRACCETCNLCTNCALTNLNLKNCHELISKLVNGEQIGDVCEILRLRLSIILLRTFRNFRSHLTNAYFEEIDKVGLTKEIREKFDIPPFCNSLASMYSTFKFADEQILDYLNENNIISEEEITSHKESIDEVVKATRHSDLDKDEFAKLLKDTHSGVQELLIKAKSEGACDEKTLKKEHNRYVFTIRNISIIKTVCW